MRGAQFACGLFGRVVDVGFVFVGGGDLEFAVEDRDEIRGKADTDKDSAELFFGSEGTNDGFAELKAMRLRVITAGEELLHGFMQVGAGLVKRIVAGVFASEAAKVGAVGDAIHLGEEKPGGDAGSWLVRVLDGDDWGMQVCLYILKKQIPRGKEPGLGLCRGLEVGFDGADVGLQELAAVDLAGLDLCRAACVDEVGIGDAEKREEGAQVRFDEVERGHRGAGIVDAAGGNEKRRTLALKEAFGTAVDIGEGFASACDLVDPELERGGNAEVVHGNPDHIVVGLLELRNQ
jgi:hypothetical protein